MHAIITKQSNVQAHLKALLGTGKEQRTTLQEPKWYMVGQAFSFHFLSFASKGHTNTVNHLRFSPDGRWIISAGEDGVAKVSRISVHFLSQVCSYRRYVCMFLYLQIQRDFHFVKHPPYWDIGEQRDLPRVPLIFFRFSLFLPCRNEKKTHL